MHKKPNYKATIRQEIYIVRQKKSVPEKYKRVTIKESSTHQGGSHRNQYTIYHFSMKQRIDILSGRLIKCKARLTLHGEGKYHRVN